MPEEHKEKARMPTEGRSFTPVLTSILQPPAEFIGEQLRDVLKEKVDGWRARRRAENLEKHAQAVRDRLRNDFKGKDVADESFTQLELCYEWVNAVQDVDPADAELSGLWHNLLAAGVSGTPVRQELVQALKLLTPREANLLINWEKRAPAITLRLNGYISREDRYLFSQLEAKGLAERDYAMVISMLSILILAIGFLIFLTTKLDQGRFHFAVNSGPITLLTIALVILSSSFSLRSGGQRWRPTWLGNQLLATAKPYHKRPRRS